MNDWTRRPKARDGHRYPCPALVFFDSRSCMSRARHTLTQIHPQMKTKSLTAHITTPPKKYHPRQWEPEGTKSCKREESIRPYVCPYIRPPIHEIPGPAHIREPALRGMRRCRDIRTDIWRYSFPLGPLPKIEYNRQIFMNHDYTRKII